MRGSLEASFSKSIKASRPLVTCDQVVVSDRPGPVLDRLQRNLRLNAVEHREHELPLRAWALDWAAAQPTEGPTLCHNVARDIGRERKALCVWLDIAGEAPVFDVILGADILYDRSSLPSLVLALQNHLAPGGSFYCVDPGRLDNCAVRNSFVRHLCEEHPEWECDERTLEASMPAAESMCMMPGAVDAQSMMHPHIHIRLHEQRRRGLAAALGLPEAALGQTISVHQLIAADAPYKLLVVHRPVDGKE